MRLCLKGFTGQKGLMTTERHGNGIYEMYAACFGAVPAVMEGGGGCIAHCPLPIGHISNRGVLGSQRMSCKSRQSVKKVKKSWKLQDFSLKSLQ
jgi:hypothetical protein